MGKRRSPPIPAESMNTLLELHNVTKVFGGGLFSRNRTTALEDLSLTISGDQPSITAVVGESGSGKTTLARLLLGIVSPTRGNISYKGKDVANMSRAERREFRREVQPIFQDPFEVYNRIEDEEELAHKLRELARKYIAAGTSNRPV